MPEIVNANLPRQQSVSDVFQGMSPLMFRRSPVPPAQSPEEAIGSNPVPPAATAPPQPTGYTPSDQAPAAFIFHHTGGGGTPQGVMDTLNQRHLGVEYIMDRQGNIVPFSQPGASHMLPGWGAGAGLSNRNTLGMEVIAANNADVTPAQIAAAQRFVQQNYPHTPVYGHGQVNPGHKEADEGMAIVNAINAQRGSSSTPQY